MLGTWAVKYTNSPSPGNIVFSEGKADCASPPWCNVFVVMTDPLGKKKPGKIEKMDDNFRHAIFTFGTLKFDTRMSAAQNEMAGTVTDLANKKAKWSFRASRM